MITINVEDNPMKNQQGFLIPVLFCWLNMYLTKPGEALIQLVCFATPDTIDPSNSVVPLIEEEEEWILFQTEFTIGQVDFEDTTPDDLQDATVDSLIAIYPQLTGKITTSS